MWRRCWIGLKKSLVSELLREPDRTHQSVSLYVNRHAQANHPNRHFDPLALLPADVLMVEIGAIEHGSSEPFLDQEVMDHGKRGTQQSHRLDALGPLKPKLLSILGSISPV